MVTAVYFQFHHGGRCRILTSSAVRSSSSTVAVIGFSPGAASSGERSIWLTPVNRNRLPPAIAGKSPASMGKTARNQPFGVSTAK